MGDYKKVPNEVGGMDTALPEEVAERMKELISEYNGKKMKSLEDILDFHVWFERIQPLSRWKWASRPSNHVQRMLEIQHSSIHH